MISVQEALEKIQNTSSTLRTRTIPIHDALNHTLAEDVFSTINMPPFDQSAMDGYAIHLHNNETYALIGETKAGDANQHSLQPGEAIRIFTGGIVPEGANAVAKQEIVERNNDSITLTEAIKLHANIRPKGEQIQQGDLGIKKGTFLNAGAVGFLATLGRSSVEVYEKPKVTVIATGNELVKPGEPLTEGKIYESNTPMIQAALKSMHLNSKTTTVHDDYTATRESIHTALENSDVLILTGGISVGDYDFVGDALEELGVEKIFYKVKQKPGKPLYYGKKENKLIFALPGNPAAALSCFYVYVSRALNKMTGKNGELVTTQAKLTSSYTKTPNLTHFLKARTDNGLVEILPAQSSAMLSSFVHANCILVAEEGKEEWKEGEIVNIVMLP